MDNNFYSNLLFEVDQIKDPAVGLVAIRCFRSLPEYFWKIPSSSSGKYHPEDEIKEGGLVLHTLRTIKVFKEMAPLHKFSQHEIDLGVAALVLHDCCKAGMENEPVEHTLHEHPLLAAKFIKEHAPKECEKEAKQIASLVKTHMGQWNTSKYSKVKLPVPKTALQKAVHEADYIASRKAFVIPIEEFYFKNYYKKNK